MKTLVLAAAAVGMLAAGASRARDGARDVSAILFQTTGFIQSATVDPSCSKNHCSGTITVDGRTIEVPNGVTVNVKSSKLAWADILALGAPLTGFEATVSGSHVVNGSVDTFIATKITLVPMALNGPSGFSNGMQLLFAPH
jgi:allantoicase